MEPFEKKKNGSESSEFARTDNFLISYSLLDILH